MVAGMANTTQPSLHLAFENTQWRKVKQIVAGMADTTQPSIPLWCEHSAQPSHLTFENTQWRKVKQKEHYTTIPPWPPHSSALVQAIRPLGTTQLKGSQDTSAPLMGERSNRWATQTAPLRRQRRQHVRLQHQSGKTPIVSKPHICTSTHATYNRHSLISMQNTPFLILR